MKRTRNGIVYDTETATEIARGDHGHPSSDAFWALYRKQNGSFFELVVDHDGVPEGIYPLTRRGAYVWLERHANHLVEKYFGEVSEIASPRFSRGTRIAAIEVLEEAIKTHADLKRLLLKLGADVAARCGDGALKDRCNSLVEYLDEDETRRTDDGDFLQDVLVEAAVRRLPNAAWDDPPAYDETQTAFVRLLARDGYAVVEGALHAALPTGLDLPDAPDEISRLLAKHGLSTAKDHLRQAIGAHVRGDWAAANSQIRCFIEALLDAIADHLDPGAVPSKNGSARGDRLAKAGFLEERLGEWDDKGKNFTNGLMKRLHSDGPHPGLSDEEDSTFRLHLVLVAAGHWLSRYDRWPHRP